MQKIKSEYIKAERIPMPASNICPNCKETAFFSFGTCSKCGYNHFTDEFEWIVVNISSIKNHPDIKYLIDQHHRNTAR